MTTEPLDSDPEFDPDKLWADEPDIEEMPDDTEPKVARDPEAVVEGEGE